MNRRKVKLVEVWDKKISIRSGGILSPRKEVNFTAWQADVKHEWTTLRFRDGNIEFNDAPAEHLALDDAFRYIWTDLALIEQQRREFQSNRFHDDDFPNRSLAVINLLVTL